MSAGREREENARARPERSRASLSFLVKQPGGLGYKLHSKCSKRSRVRVWVDEPANWSRPHPPPRGLAHATMAFWREHDRTGRDPSPDRTARAVSTFSPSTLASHTTRDRRSGRAVFPRRVFLSRHFTRTRRPRLRAPGQCQNRRPRPSRRPLLPEALAKSSLRMSQEESSRPLQ